MGSVSEAKYTYWHTIVDLAEASEMPKAEWCRKNCISIKTFNHYEGIFRRQEARKASYNKEDSDGKLIGDVDGTDKSASLRTSNYRQADGSEESVISVSNEADTTDQDGELTDAKGYMNLPDSGETTGEDKARYFEVPMPGRKGGRKAYISKEGAKKKTKL